MNSIISLIRRSKRMIDWHSHILPGMDDGSRDVAESMAMLEMEAAQGIRTVVATPHFYANDESLESFLDRRSAAFAALKAQLPKDAPEVVLGAEVRYYQGISRMEDMKALRIGGSRLLLLEMPMITWTEYMIRELIELSARSGIRLVLAHVERYFGLQKRELWKRLADHGILMQVNASFLTTFASKRKAISLLKEGSVRFVGSDCHNITTRSPQMGKALELIQKKLGPEFVSQMNEYGYALLAKNMV